jgi:hypothetical protein
VDELQRKRETIYKRLEENFTLIAESNNRLELRATWISTTTTAAIGLVSSRYLPASQSTGQAVALGLACVLAIVVLVVASKVWNPGWRCLPGPNKYTAVYEKYIDCSEEDAFDQMVSNVLNSIEIETNRNSYKADMLELMLRFVLVELIVLAVAIAWPVFAMLTKA